MILHKRLIRKHNDGGISLYEINSLGRDKQDADQEMVEVYTTGRSIQSMATKVDPWNI
jgi:hypothetical protein